MRRAASTTVLVAAVAAAALAGGSPAARAQVPTFPSNTTTTTTRPVATTTPTTGVPEEPAPSTTAPPPPPAGGEAPAPEAPAQPGPEASAPSPPPAGPTGAGGPPPAPAGGPGAPPPAPGPGTAPGPPAEVAPGEVPADVQAQINAVRRSPANNTRKLLAALAPLLHLGMSEQEAIVAGFGRFPVGGYASFSHDWLFPRFTPSFHLHEGTDVFATTGTPVRAPAAGTLKLSQGGAGGLAAYVYEPNGTYYYMAHLAGFVPGQVQGQRVALGQVVGYVGDSGNAKGGAPHLHFEIHPAPTRTVVTGKGKRRATTTVVRPVPVGTVLPPVDPKAHLDQWLREALADAPRVIASVEARPRALQATALTRRVGTGAAGLFPGPVAPSRDQLLWMSSANPSGGALRLAEAEAMVVADEFDWSLAARRRQARLEELAEAQARVEALLRPLTPPSLQSLPAVGD